MTCPRRVTAKDVGKLVLISDMDQDFGEDKSIRTIDSIEGNAGEMGFWSRHPRGHGSQWMNVNYYFAVSEAFDVPDPAQPTGGETTTNASPPV
jgi:hypothetical protein